MIKVGSDFSGVGAFDQALRRLNIEYQTEFSCDMDKYARQTYIENYGKPKYYPENVYDREIPKESLDIYMTSPPCQAFSLAGKRKGENDKRGILFYNSHEFIQKNNPRYFIFENVKGLLSDASGKTFQTWIDMLGGKSVNGNPVIFPREDSTPYHVYYKVLNAKNYGVPQNRERVFIIGIRDDEDNNFQFPKPFHLTKRLKDVLEDDVDEKYFLSDKMISCIMTPAKEKWQSGKMEIDLDIARPITATCHKMHRADTDNYVTEKIIKIGNTNPSGNGMNGNVFDSEGISPTLSTNKGEGIKVKSATKKGYEIATDNDSINFSVPNSETRRGRVGKGVAQTLDTQCNQGVMIGAIRGRNIKKKETQQMLELNKNGTSNSLTTVQKDNVVFIADYRNDEGLRIRKDNISPCMTSSMKGGEWKANRGTRNPPVVGFKSNTNKIIYDKPIEKKGWHNKAKEVLNTDGLSTCIHTQSNNLLQKITEPNTFKIRRLTPRECFRLMDFPDTFKMPCSNTQMYKQAGNSIVVNVLSEIINKLKL